MRSTILVKENRKKKWTLDDLTKKDLELLTEASMRPERTWFCFGLSFYKLFQLNAVDENTTVTPFGVEIVKAYARMSQ